MKQCLNTSYKMVTRSYYVKYTTAATWNNFITPQYAAKSKANNNTSTSSQYKYLAKSLIIVFIMITVLYRLLSFILLVHVVDVILDTVTSYCFYSLLQWVFLGKAEKKKVVFKDYIWTTFIIQSSFFLSFFPSSYINEIRLHIYHLFSYRDKSSYDYEWYLILYALHVQ